MSSTQRNLLLFLGSLLLAIAIAALLLLSAEWVLRKRYELV